MSEKVFKIRTYGFGELASEYMPNVSKITASLYLNRTIKENTILQQKLYEAGYKSKKKILTPLMVKIIIEHLGEPF